MLTLADIDEALQHARAVPVEDRGAGWQAFVDSLLEQRNDLLRDRPMTQHAVRETRVMFSTETR